jgi:hypothetical protein
VSDRDAFREARDHGLKARHETREARAVRKAVSEEIAAAIERHSTTSAIGPISAGSFEVAARIAREIGSRDPE